MDYKKDGARSLPLAAIETRPARYARQRRAFPGDPRYRRTDSIFRIQVNTQYMPATHLCMHRTRQKASHLDRFVRNESGVLDPRQTDKDTCQIESSARASAAASWPGRTRSGRRRVGRRGGRRVPASAANAPRNTPRTALTNYLNVGFRWAWIPAHCSPRSAGGAHDKITGLDLGGSGVSDLLRSSPTMPFFCWWCVL